MGRNIGQRRRRKRLMIKISVFFIAVCVGAVLYVKYNINPVIRTFSEQTVRAMTNEAVNEAAALVMGDIEYAGVINVQKNESGDIMVISADPVAVNELARSVTLLAQAKIVNAGEQGIDIPIGTFSGLAFLAGKGKEVHFKAVPVGSAEASFRSEFTSVGINQTRHCIYLNVNACVSVIVPGMDIQIETVTQVLVTENIIIGKVPDTYLQSGELDEMLNLVP